MSSAPTVFVVIAKRRKELISKCNRDKRSTARGNPAVFDNTIDTQISAIEHIASARKVRGEGHRPYPGYRRRLRYPDSDARQELMAPFDDQQQPVARARRYLPPSLLQMSFPRPGGQFETQLDRDLLEPMTSAGTKATKYPRRALAPGPADASHRGCHRTEASPFSSADRRDRSLSEITLVVVLRPRDNLTLLFLSAVNRGSRWCWYLDYTKS